MVDIYRHDETICPNCGHRLNALAQAPGISETGPPEVGDHSVCVECLRILELTDLGYRLVDDNELATWTREERNEIQQTIKFITASRN